MRLHSLYTCTGCLLCSNNTGLATGDGKSSETQGATVLKRENENKQGRLQKQEQAFSPELLVEKMSKIQMKVSQSVSQAANYGEKELEGNKEQA